MGKDAKVQYLDVSIVLMAGDEEGTNTNPVVKPVTPSTESKAPQTGDSSSFMVYAVICLVALLAIVLVKKRNVLVKTRLPKK